MPDIERRHGHETDLDAWRQIRKPHVSFVSAGGDIFEMLLVSRSFRAVLKWQQTRKVRPE
jgi:hypothetical protein